MISTDNLILSLVLVRSVKDVSFEDSVHHCLLQNEMSNLLIVIEDNVVDRVVINNVVTICMCHGDLKVGFN